jgi:two-component system, cell cycle sensor histidine kinase and response regulator CckA
VGRLAGGVAHDFNNLLTVILGCAEDLRAGVAAASPADVEYVDDIIGASRRAADLTRQLLAFARKQVATPVTVDLNDLVLSSLKLLERAIGEDVRVVSALEPAPWSVRCDPGLIGQVIMNLGVNARDAMPDGGTLTLATANVPLVPGDVLPSSGMVPGHYVRLTVQDTGTGMSKETMEHIFEPFFTTKEHGKGTGLGLSTVYGILKQSEAHVTVQSSPGEGTTFQVWFPRDRSRTGPTAETPHRSDRGSERVLVVEDNPGVRDVAVRALRAGGYEVLEASGAEEALASLRADGRPLHLLLTDVVMPGLGGREAARRVVELRPGVRVLFMSGYADGAAHRAGGIEPGADFLPKPFTGPALRARVREVLDRP